MGVGILFKNVTADSLRKQRVGCTLGDFAGDAVQKSAPDSREPVGRQGNETGGIALGPIDDDIGWLAPHFVLVDAQGHR
jgi:hypothetical protein